MSREEQSPYESRLAFLLEMSKEERRIFFAEEAVQAEEYHLQWMIEQNKRDDEFIAYASAKAKQYISDIKSHGYEEQWMFAAEQWSEIATGTKETKFTIGDIRKQRERIQWEKKRLNKLRETTEARTKQQSDEQQPSSSP